MTEEPPTPQDDEQPAGEADAPAGGSTEGAEAAAEGLDHLPAGEHRVEFRYQPPRFVIGGAVSALGWLGLAAVAAVMWMRRRRHPQIE